MRDTMFERITTFFTEKLGVDGLLHVLACKLAVDACELFMPLWAAVLVAVLCGLAKEFVYDRWMKKGTFDRRDFLADGIGIALGLI